MVSGPHAPQLYKDGRIPIPISRRSSFAGVGSSTVLPAVAASRLPGDNHLQISSRWGFVYLVLFVVIWMALVVDVDVAFPKICIGSFQNASIPLHERWKRLFAFLVVSVWNGCRSCWSGSPTRFAILDNWAIGISVDAEEIRLFLKFR